MKIGDEIFAHGYVDEIRNNTIIVKNKGGYFCTVKSEINNIEEKVGTWEERFIEDDFSLFRRRFYCSACNEWNTYGMSKYCPNCGARMRKGKVNNE